MLREPALSRSPGKREQVSRRIADHAEAVRICLEQLTHPQTGCIKSVEEVSAIGFKPCSLVS